jgi:hypothetical protein
VDTLAKKAASNESLTEEYNRIPKSVVTRELEEESVRKWQRNWTEITKGSKPHTKFHGNNNRTRKNKRLLTQIYNHTGSNMHLRKSSTDNRPPDL